MLLRQTQLANYLGVSARTVRNWIAAGMPSSPSGIDPDAARQWVAAHVDHHQTGWVTRRLSSEAPTPAPAGNRAIYLAGGVDALNRARQPGALEFIAEVVLALGGSPMVAVGVASQLDLLIAAMLGEWAKSPDAAVIKVNPEPDWGWLQEISGVEIDAAAAGHQADKRVAAWSKKPHGFTGRPKEVAPK